MHGLHDNEIITRIVKKKCTYPASRMVFTRNIYDIINKINNKNPSLLKLQCISNKNTLIKHIISKPLGFYVYSMLSHVLLLLQRHHGAFKKIYRFCIQQFGRQYDLFLVDSDNAVLERLHLLCVEHVA